MTTKLTGRAALATAVLATAALAAPTAAIADDGSVVVDEGESIQEAIDAAEPGTTIVVRGDHVENVWIDKSGISLVGKRGATITQPDDPTSAPCDFVDGSGTLRSTTICVWPDNFDFPVPADEALSNVTISGLTVSNPTYDAIGVYFTNGIRVTRNSTADTGCSGIFLLFTDDFRVDRNDVTRSGGGCNAIDVAGSTNGVVTRNTASDSDVNGIAINDSSNVVVSRNIATGNCQGIGAFDNPDPRGLPVDNVTITRNVATGNNTICFPFDPPGSQAIPVGGAGIIVAGTDNAVISRNVASDNVVDGFTLTAAGIFVADFPGDGLTGAPFSVSTNTTVDRNTAFGNSSVVGPVDLRVETLGNLTSIDRNHCGVSVPDGSWCGG